MATSLLVLQEAGAEGFRGARLSQGPQGNGCNAHKWRGEVEKHWSNLGEWVLLAVGHVDDEGVVLTRQLIRPCETRKRKKWLVQSRVYICSPHTPTDQLGRQGTAVRGHSCGGGGSDVPVGVTPRGSHPKSCSVRLCQSTARQPLAWAAGLGQSQRRPGRAGERWALQVSQSTPRKESRRHSESRHSKYSFSEPIQARERKREQ